MRMWTLGLAAILAINAGSVSAQTYPTKPITILQGFGAGGSADTLARLIGDYYSREMGQPVIVEARAGAGGNIASEAAAKAKPDGYTLLLLPASHTVSAAMYEKLRFDPVKDFTFISTLMEYPLAIVTSPGSPYGTFEDAIAAARNKPEGITYSSVGHGSAMHLAGEWIGVLSGGKLIHVPYRGGAQPLVDVMAGRTDLMIATPAATVESIKAGHVRALANTGREEHSSLPRVPPASKLLPGFEVYSWLGIAAPAGLPESVISRLSKVTIKALNDPVFREKLDLLGGSSPVRSLSETREFVENDIERWKKVVELAKIKKVSSN